MTMLKMVLKSTCNSLNDFHELQKPGPSRDWRHRFDA